MGTTCFSSCPSTWRGPRALKMTCLAALLFLYRSCSDSFHFELDHYCHVCWRKFWKAGRTSGWPLGGAAREAGIWWLLASLVSWAKRCQSLYNGFWLLLLRACLVHFHQCRDNAIMYAAHLLSVSAACLLPIPDFLFRGRVCRGRAESTLHYTSALRMETPSLKTEPLVGPTGQKAFWLRLCRRVREARARRVDSHQDCAWFVWSAHTLGAFTHGVGSNSLFLCKETESSDTTEPLHDLFITCFE